VALPSRLVLALAAVCALTLSVLAGTAGARSVEYKVPVRGVEVWASNKVGTFVGTSDGPLAGAWRTSVAHTPLRRSADITGGTYELVVHHRGDVTRIRGTFHDGRVEVIKPEVRSHCANERFRVTPVGADARGVLFLIHYRRGVFGSCVIYSASLRGTMWITVDTTRPGVARSTGGRARSSIDTAVSTVGGWLGRVFG